MVGLLALFCGYFYFLDTDYIHGRKFHPLPFFRSPLLDIILGLLMIKQFEVSSLLVRSPIKITIIIIIKQVLLLNCFSL